MKQPSLLHGVISGRLARLEFQDAFDRIALGPEKKSHVMTQEDKETVAYHEAGHAVVSFHLLNYRSDSKDHHCAAWPSWWVCIAAARRAYGYTKEI